MANESGIDPSRPNGRDHVDAHVAGQKIALSTNNLIAVLFIGLIGVLLWMFWGSGQVIMQRDIADRHRIAAEAQQDFESLRQAHATLLLRLEHYHAMQMTRQVDVARAVARWLLIHDHNEGRPISERIPFGVPPPWLEEQLQPPSLPRKE